MSNNHEIEVKFKIDNPEGIKQKLKKLRAPYVGKAFERTILFDTPTLALRQQGKFLRIKTGFKTVTTLKRKMSELDHQDFKVREEIELEISDLDKLKIIYEQLGFTETAIMEKYRERWYLNKVEVDLDQLPFGFYLEIEGSKKEIEDTVKALCLDSKKRITVTYWAIWRDLSGANFSNQRDIVFEK